MTTHGIARRSGPPAPRAPIRARQRSCSGAIRRVRGRRRRSSRPEGTQDGLRLSAPTGGPVAPAGERRPGRRGGDGPAGPLGPLGGRPGSRYPAGGLRGGLRPAGAPARALSASWRSRVGSSQRGQFGLGMAVGPLCVRSDRASVFPGRRPRRMRHSVSRRTYRRAARQRTTQMGILNSPPPSDDRILVVPRSGHAQPTSPGRGPLLASGDGTRDRAPVHGVVSLADKSPRAHGVALDDDG
jgi:hypothetical protein